MEKRAETDSGQARARRRPGGRNAEVREAVRRAARALLAEGGFGAVTFPAVARRAGVAKTTLYRSWGSPGELVEAALAELEALALPDVDTGRFDLDVEAFVASRLALLREPHAAAILRAVVGTGEAPAALFDWIETFWKPRRRGWRSPIERAIERGELAPSARAVPLIELVAGPLLLSELVTRRRLTRAEIRAIAAVVVAGVRAEHPPRSARGGRTARATSTVSPSRAGERRSGSRSSRASR
ncbi:MAG: TetR/AcrR family transcriptional regulator [Myxococcota bacterium]